LFESGCGHNSVSDHIILVPVPGIIRQMTNKDCKQSDSKRKRPLHCIPHPESVEKQLQMSLAAVILSLHNGRLRMKLHTAPGATEALLYIHLCKFNKHNVNTNM
jgi:hypothetical protein